MWLILSRILLGKFWRWVHLDKLDSLISLTSSLWLIRFTSFFGASIGHKNSFTGRFFIASSSATFSSFHMNYPTTFFCHCKSCTKCCIVLMCLCTGWLAYSLLGTVLLGYPHKTTMLIFFFNSLIISWFMNIASGHACFLVTLIYLALQLLSNTVCCFLCYLRWCILLHIEASGNLGCFLVFIHFVSFLFFVPTTLGFLVNAPCIRCQTASPMLSLSHRRWELLMFISIHGLNVILSSCHLEFFLKEGARLHLRRIKLYIAVSCLTATARALLLNIFLMNHPSF